MLERAFFVFVDKVLRMVYKFDCIKKDESTMKYFTKLLRIRNSMKALQQISWTISQFERRYNVDNLDEETAKELVEAYLDYVPQLSRLLDELKDEGQNENKNCTH